MIRDDSALNPYRSPSMVSGGHAPLVEPWLGVYRPAIMYKDALDVILGLSFGALGAALLLSIPFGLLFYFQTPIEGYGIVALVFLGIAVVAMMLGIRHIELTPVGIVATRRLLSPLRIPWSQVESVQIADRGDVLLTTAFRPHRCCSYSCTSRDQIRIETIRVRIFFPPQDAVTFYVTARLLAAQQNPTFSVVHSPNR